MRCVCHDDVTPAKGEIQTEVKAQAEAETTRQEGEEEVAGGGLGDALNATAQTFAQSHRVLGKGLLLNLRNRALCRDTTRCHP